MGQPGGFGHGAADSGMGEAGRVRPLGASLHVGKLIA